MALTTHPVTPSRFDDFAAMVNPNRRASHCWCLSHRLSAREIEELGHGSRERGAPAVEAYPVDAEGGRIDTTMAFVGTRAMFEKAGFAVVGETDALASKRPRLIMRRAL